MDLQDVPMEDPILQQGGGESIPHPAGDFQLPSQEKLLEMIEKLNMSEEEKQEIRDGILKNIVNRFQGDQGPTRSGVLIVAACVLILISMFVFFGYKLYRSQTEKERKREEKKKLKQQKKKHKS